MTPYKIKSMEIERYQDKVISCPDSPTRKAYVGLAKQPLMRNENGIGYQGVKLQTDDRTKIQCYGCGKWYRSITNCHTKKYCRLGLKEYRKKFGYNVETALVSDEYSRQLAAQMVHSPVIMANMEKWRSGDRDGEKRSRKYHKVSRERQNLLGTCPEQLKARLIEHIHRFHRVPNKSYGLDAFPITTYKDRYGSFNAALASFGLPTRYKMGRIVEYKFADNTVFHTNGGMGFEELYIIMCEKCEVLQCKL